MWLTYSLQNQTGLFVRALYQAIIHIGVGVYHNLEPKSSLQPKWIFIVVLTFHFRLFLDVQQIV